ncbi:hypothetical protein L195_g061018, partial [Trifolium pratense]
DVAGMVVRGVGFRTWVGVGVWAGAGIWVWIGIGIGTCDDEVEGVDEAVVVIGLVVEKRCG